MHVLGVQVTYCKDDASSLASDETIMCVLAGVGLVVWSTWSVPPSPSKVVPTVMFVTLSVIAGKAPGILFSLMIESGHGGF